MAAAQLGYRCHIYAPDADSVAADVCGAIHPRRRTTTRTALTRFADDGRRRHLRVREYPGRRRSPRSAQRAAPAGPQALEIAQDRLTEKSFVDALGGAHRALRARSTTRDELDAALERDRRARRSSRRAASAMTARARRGSSTPSDADAGLGRDRRRAGDPRRLRRLRRRILGAARAAARDGETRSLGSAATTSTRTASSHARPCPPGRDRSPQVAEARALAGRDRRRARLCRRARAANSSPRADGPVFNEMAPRVHNSGHWTIEGARHLASSRITSARSAACRSARPTLAANGVDDDQSDRRRSGWLAGDPRRAGRPSAPLRQGRSRGPAARWAMSPG